MRLPFTGPSETPFTLLGVRVVLRLSSPQDCFMWHAMRLESDDVRREYLLPPEMYMKNVIAGPCLTSWAATLLQFCKQ